jgi:hypothetical protein
LRQKASEGDHERYGERRLEWQLSIRIKTRMNVAVFSSMNDAVQRGRANDSPLRKHQLAASVATDDSPPTDRARLSPAAQ